MIDSVELERTVAAGLAAPAAPPARQRRTGPLLLGLSILFLCTVFSSVGLFGVRGSVISGGSMEPRWHRGDVIVTRSADLSDLEVGDVITFRFETTRVVHRITEVHENEQGPVYITQGDNNPAADRPVSGEDVEGKVIFSIPAAGRPLLLFKSWIASR